MTHPIPPYPLQWPDTQPRSARQVTSQFRTSLGGAIDNVKGSIKKFASDSGKKIDDVQATSNASLTMTKPKDPGVSVWFNWDGQMRCIAVDKYSKVECNLQAIHHVIEARRTELRHAGIQMVRTSFRGFVALPPPRSSGAIPPQHWFTVLGVEQDATPDQINAAYRAKSRENPDGSVQSALNVARDDGLAVQE